MGKIFISYRRDDSEYIVGRIYEDLCATYGRKNIFKDVDSIPLGVDFRDEISKVVHSCDILLALIGENWITISDETGNRRINDPDDFVRIEIEEALKRDIPVIPIITSKAELPKEDQLPDALKKLAYRNAIEIRPDPDYKTDIIRLKNNIDKTYRKVSKRKYILFSALLIIATSAALYYIIFIHDRIAVIHDDGRRTEQVTKETHRQPITIGEDKVVDDSTTTIKEEKRSLHSKPLKVLDRSLPRNNEDESSTGSLIQYFDDLQELDGEIIYIRFSTYVGAGFGIEDVPNNNIRAGVVFDLADYLDGFGGSTDDYEYGYSIELDEYRDEWRFSRQSTILFPKKGNAFFDVHYMKSMNFEGLAKIQISGIQGFQWIEIIPAEPFGDLKEQYDEIKSQIKARPTNDQVGPETLPEPSHDEIPQQLEQFHKELERIAHEEMKAREEIERLSQSLKTDEHAQGAVEHHQRRLIEKQHKRLEELDEQRREIEHETKIKTKTRTPNDQVEPPPLPETSRNEILLKIEEFHRDLERISHEEGKARKEIKQLSQFSETDPDAQEAIENQHRRLEQLEEQRAEIEHEIERLNEQL